ncbi:MAG: PEP-CTERM sorting domain-containing protein, partial [Chthonomonadaceae bacterium]|nr:PEP-CTERM sorting domain-containing protein [Chthonomonadaceae bacterium]
NSTTLVLGVSLMSGATYGQIANGSFETGTAYVNGPNIFQSGTPTPWFATSFTPDCYDNTGVDGWNLAGIPAYGGMFQNMLASHGNRFIGFGAGATFSESFKQVMSPLTPGSSYTITADMAVDDLGKDNGTYGGPYLGRGMIDVRINGSSVGQFAQNTLTYTWEVRSVTFIAPTASSYDVEFVAMNDPLTRAPSYMALDNIGMVPEPTSLLGISCGLAAVVRRRRR